MILQIHTSKSVKETIHYHTGRKSEEAYYSTDGQEFAGCWGGKGAEMLGLKGRVTDEAFASLCNNLHPITGKQLTPRMRSDRRPGFDCNFNVPKSVSLLYAWTKDERIIWALRQAQLDTLLEMQNEAATRVRAGGVEDGDRKTGVLVWAEIIHLTARPEGGIPDPHLHSHCYVFNVTWDADEKKWKALQMGRIHDEAASYERLAAMRLAENLRSLGLEIVPTEHAFEIAGISRELVEKFSRRSKTIEEEAIRRGITDPAEKAKLAALTRERKSKSLLISELEPFWWGNLLPEEAKALNAGKTLLQRSRAVELSKQMAGETIGPASAVESSKALGTMDGLPPVRTREIAASSDFLGTRQEAKTAGVERRRSLNQKTRPVPSANITVNVTEHDRRAVFLAIEHIFERESAVTELQLIAEASKKWCIDKTTLAGIRQVVAEAPLIRRVRDERLYVTTAEVYAEEQRIIKSCQDGLGRFDPMNRFWQIRDEELTAEQKAAALHLLNSRDFITGISGNPGVGKTRILREFERGAKASFNKVIMLATWGVTAHEVLRKEGFENAETVAKLLASEKLQEEAREAVWVVDEAGLLPTREADGLITLARELGSRLVFVGDVGQHYGVERGQAFDLLLNDGKMRAVEVREIQRQRGAYKRFVEQVLAGDFTRAFMSLDNMDAICEMTLEERKIALAKDYVAAIEKGESALVVAPTHVERRDVTEGIRDALKEKGHLKHRGKRMVSRELSWENWQKSDPAQYKSGMIVQFDAPGKGFKMLEQGVVIGVRDGMVRVRCGGPFQSKIKALPLSSPEKFSVRVNEMEHGDQWDVLRNLSWTDAQKSDHEHYERGLVVQMNGHVKGFALGEELDVLGVSDGVVRVRNSADKDSRVKMLPLSEAEKFGVYERDKMEICEGELLHITGNGRTEDRHRLNNGKVCKVDHITHDGKIVLDNGWRVDRNFKHLEYGYALTSHAAQGKTVDRVLITQSAQLSYGAIDFRQFLVSCTRGSKGLKIYTDDLELLKERVSEKRERLMATELLREPAKEMEREEGLVKSSAHLGMEDAHYIANAIEPPQKSIELEHEQELEEEMELSL